MEASKDRLTLHYLASYSPELNPDEHVGNYLKKNKLRNHIANTVNKPKKLTLLREIAFYERCKTNEYCGQK